MDLGSNRTLIDKELYDDLSLHGTATTLKLVWTQGVEAVVESFIANISLRGVSGRKWS